MRVSKQIIPVFIVVMLLAASVSFAQDQQQWRQKMTPDQRAKNQTEMMQKNLSLTKDQYGKVYDINLYYANETDSLMKMPRGRDKRAERESIQKDKEAELKNVLSPDQYQKYQAMVAEMKQRMEERRNSMQQGEGGN